MNIYRALPQEIQFRIAECLPTDESKKETQLQKWRDYYQRNKQERSERSTLYRQSHREEF